MDTPESILAEVLDQPTERTAQRLREQVRKLRGASYESLMGGLLGSLSELRSAAVAKDYQHAAACAGSVATHALALYGQGLALSIMTEAENGAPVLGENLACAFDLRELEKQPHVKAGDEVTLATGERVVLGELPADVLPAVFQKGAPGSLIENTKPALLGFQLGGRWHMGAVDGRSVIGLPPVMLGSADDAREALRQVMARGQT